MSQSILILTLAAIVVLLLVVITLLWRWRDPGRGDALEAMPRWALTAIGAAYNAALDELIVTGELPDGDTRRRLALAYYEHIPPESRAFTADEFADAVDRLFLAVEWGGTRLIGKLPQSHE
jgi:hypothetical protein